jgi:rod shape determining protein RodA
MSQFHMNWRAIRRYFAVFDGPLAILIFLIMSCGIVTLYSAGYDFPGRVEDQLRNIVVSFCDVDCSQCAAANADALCHSDLHAGCDAADCRCVVWYGEKGIAPLAECRYCDSAFEMLKIATPLMLAWYFQKREGALRVQDFVIATIILHSVRTDSKQPDLGTAMLVGMAGFTVIFLAGLSWKLILGILGFAAAVIPTIVWPYMLHDYQRDRVLTLLDPSRDPLGKGFHIIQSTIAVGSGGVTGKGWLKGTQAHLEFIPERTTDFIFAVFSEEFGLVGNLVLLLLYLLLIARCLMIAANAPTLFTRLIGGFDDSDLFHLCICEYGYGQWYSARGGCAAAVYELRWYSAGDAGHGRRHPDECATTS